MTQLILDSKYKIIFQMHRDFGLTDPIKLYDLVLAFKQELGFGE
jgi:hypothetical protein